MVFHGHVDGSSTKLDSQKLELLSLHINSAVQGNGVNDIRSKGKVYFGHITSRTAKVCPFLFVLILGTGISGTDFFHDMMREFGWIKKLGIVLRQRA